jgi:hypothetical protein
MDIRDSSFFIENPDSERIAHLLNENNETVCCHGRNPCYIRCGVRRVSTIWEAIPKNERLEWLKEI